MTTESKAQLGGYLHPPGTAIVLKGTGGALTGSYVMGSWEGPDLHVVYVHLPSGPHLINVKQQAILLPECRPIHEDRFSSSDPYFLKP